MKDLKSIILNKDPLIYEEDRDGSEWYRCFWCGERIRENSEGSWKKFHSKSCVYYLLLEEDDAVYCDAGTEG